jgi:5-methylcytosine-specific restriction endonuclease McrA
MPHAKLCIGCGEIIPASRTRCGRCARKKNRVHTEARGAYHTPEWRRLSAEVTANGCEVFGCTATHYVVAHHIWPRELGGPDSRENLVALCGNPHHAEAEAQIRRELHDSPRTALMEGHLNIETSRESRFRR